LCERFTELALPFQKLSGDIENHISIILLLHTTFKLLSEAGLNIKPEK
jgi:hypothetical protein